METSLLVYLYHLPAIIKAAGGANPVGRLKAAALGAFGQRGGLQLPHIGAPLVLPCAGYFSLGYRHSQHLLTLNKSSVKALGKAGKHCVYKSWRRTSSRGSVSRPPHPQGPWFRFLPQLEQSPRQSSRHKNCPGRSSKISSRISWTWTG